VVQQHRGFTLLLLLLKALCGFAAVGAGRACVGSDVAATGGPLVSGPPMGAWQGWGLGRSSSRSPSVQRSLQHSCLPVALNGGMIALGQARSDLYSAVIL